MYLGTFNSRSGAVTTLPPVACRVLTCPLSDPASLTWRVSHRNGLWGFGSCRSRTSWGRAWRASRRSGLEDWQSCRSRIFSGRESRKCSFGFFGLLELECRRITRVSNRKLTITFTASSSCAFLNGLARGLAYAHAADGSAGLEVGEAKGTVGAGGCPCCGRVGKTIPRRDWPRETQKGAKCGRGGRGGWVHPNALSSMRSTHGGDDSIQ